MSGNVRGLIHVYTGEGKGKTTAALGLALRAAGHGRRTFFGQFMKGQDYGELKAATMLCGTAAGSPGAPPRSLLTIRQFGKPTFIHIGEATPDDTRMAQEGLAAVHKAMLSGEYQIVVLDEVNVALYFRLLTVEDVLTLIDDKPPEVELILTGRRVPDEILSRADYVTEMREVKHPYRQGIAARKGIEF